MNVQDNPQITQAQAESLAERRENAISILIGFAVAVLPVALGLKFMFFVPMGDDKIGLVMLVTALVGLAVKHVLSGLRLNPVKRKNHFLGHLVPTAEKFMNTPQATN